MPAHVGVNFNIVESISLDSESFGEADRATVFALMICMVRSSIVDGASAISLVSFSRRTAGSGREILWIGSPQHGMDCLY